MTDFAGLPVDKTPSQTLLEMLKAHLGIEGADKDADLTIQINMAGPIVEGWLDRVVAQREVVEQFGAFFGTVILHHLPVGDVVSVFKDGSEQVGTFKHYTERGQTYLSRTGQRDDVPFDWRGFNQMDVTYVAGFDVLPVDLAWGLMLVAADMYGAAGSGVPPGGASGATKSLTLFNVGKVEYNTDTSSGGSGGEYYSGAGVISDQAAQLLSGYRRLTA